ncbi:MAG: hypothetical protein HYY16_07885 [Planctomycetes bacterium]|nr:hypothetical protein [Planctomycetota bacterium]
MSILEKIFRRRKSFASTSLEELRVEEKRLEIRENQHINQIDKYDKLRENVFHQGAKTKSPARRRVYARQFNEYAMRIQMMERELSRVVKELMTLNRLRGIMERQHTVGGKNLLERLSDEDLGKIIGLLEDDKVTEEMYVQKLDMMLGVVSDPAYESQDIGSEGQEVLKTWEAMDEGELDFEEGLKEASQKEPSGGTKEAKEKETDVREAEPN